jgi:hypothetical protein
MTWDMVLVIIDHANEGADLFDCFWCSILDNCFDPFDLRFDSLSGKYKSKELGFNCTKRGLATIDL